MRSFSMPVLAMVALFGAKAASAADLPSIKSEPVAPSIASCDFFQNQLIGAFCENTFGGTATLDHQQQNQNYGSYSAPGYFSSSSQQFNWFDATATAYVVPLPWLKLSVSSEHNNFSGIYNYYANDTYWPSPFYIHNVNRLSNAAWQQASATVRLVDYSTEGLRVFGGANATIGFIPAVTGNPESTQFAGSLFGGAHWALGYEDISLNPYGTMGIGHLSQFDQTNFSTSFRILLAQDVWGAAAGPIVTTLSASHLQGGGPTQSYFAGAHLLWEPFRQSQTPILRDVNLNFQILHSLGHVIGVPASVAADTMDYSGSVQINFTY
jgi:hypothetical protein